MRKDPTLFRERFKRWKEGKDVYKDGRALPAFEGGTQPKITRVYKPYYDKDRTLVSNVDAELPEVVIRGRDKTFGSDYYDELDERERKRQKNIAKEYLKHPTLPNVINAAGAYWKSLPYMITGITSSPINMGTAPTPSVSGKIDAWLYEKIMSGLKKAAMYKHSSLYKKLVEAFQDAAYNTKRYPIDKYFFNPVSLNEAPPVANVLRAKNSLGGYNPHDNIIRLDFSQIEPKYLENVAFHEGLHWLNVSDNNNPLYRNWKKTFAAADLSKDKELKRVADGMFRDYYSKYGDMGDNTEFFLNDRIKALFRSSAAPYILLPQEAAANALEAGTAVGLLPFQIYPGARKALRPIFDAQDYNPFLLDLKMKNDADIENAWKLLTGNFNP